jgi:tetratricopeptide (TPR) repeat protein
MRAVRLAKEAARLWAAGVALSGVAYMMLMLTGCDIPGYKKRTVASTTDSSVRTADTQTSLAGSVVGGTAGTMLPTAVVTPASFGASESAYRAGKFAEAVAGFTAYTTKQPSNAWGHYMLGLSAWKSGDLTMAETELTRTVEIDSTHLKSWINLGRVLLDQKRPAAALEAVERAKEIDSTSTDVYRVLGRVKSDLGLPESAVDAYRKAISIDDKDVWSLNDLGLVLLQVSKPAEALGPLARAVALKPDVAVFHNNLGMALEHAGYFVAAGDQYKVAVGIDATHTRAAANLARVTGRADGAGLAPLDLPAVVEKFLTGLAPSPRTGDKAALLTWSRAAE